MRVATKVVFEPRRQFLTVWTADGEKLVLQDIQLEVKRGELVMIVGRVGAGKVLRLPDLECTTVGNQNE